MNENLKIPKKESGKRLKDFYNSQIRNQKMSEELKEILKKKDKVVIYKKIAQPSEDLATS